MNDDSHNKKQGSSTPKPKKTVKKRDKKTKKKARGTPGPKSKPKQPLVDVNKELKLLEEKRAEFEKERKAFDEEKQSLTTELNDLRFQVKELQCINKSLKQERDRYAQQCHMCTMKVKQSQQELVKFIRQLTEYERKEKRAKLEKDNKLIGRVEISTDPLRNSSHVFRNGEKFQEYTQTQKDIDRDKKDLEVRKKELRAQLRSHRKSKQQASDNGTDSPFRKPHEPIVDQYAIRNEVLKIQAESLKQKQNQLNEKKTILAQKKTLHFKFIGNMESEARSIWRDMRILNHRYLLTTLLGKGGFSEVWKAYDLYKYRWVACKIHQLSDRWDNAKKQNYTRHAKREYEIHKSLSHPRVVPFYDIIGIDNGTFCTILQYCEGTDMDMHLKMRHHLKETEARCLIAQVLEGLKYLNEQEQPIIHYDLKPANLLIENGECKITDFGLSKMVESPTKSEIDLTTPGAGTYWYLPPECFLGTKISNRVDMWAVGVIFYQMLVGERPLGHGLTQKEILEKGSILRGEIKYPTNIKLSEEAKKFISDCLSHNPRDRPDPLTCLQTHPYFAKIRK